MVDIDNLKKLEAKGFNFVSPKQYEIARMQGPCTVILYQTGKILVQGKSEIANDVRIFLGLEAKQKVSKSTSNSKFTKSADEQTRLEPLAEEIVGSDETLKGDTFGGIVVAGFRANSSEREQLENMGVGDSKTFEDASIMILAQRLVKTFPNNYYVVSLKPYEYNELTKVDNVTRLLDKLHRQVNVKLKTEISIHVVDLYPGCRVGDIAETKAESSYVEVAAASIIARAEGLKQLDELSRSAGFRIPKGSTHVMGALETLKNSGLLAKDYVKIRFSNVERFFS